MSGAIILWDKHSGNKGPALDILTILSEVGESEIFPTLSGLRVKLLGRSLFSLPKKKSSRAFLNWFARLLNSKLENWKWYYIKRGEPKIQKGQLSSHFAWWSPSFCCSIELLDSGLNIKSNEALASSKTMGLFVRSGTTASTCGMALMILVVVGTNTFCRSNGWTPIIIIYEMYIVQGVKASSEYSLSTWYLTRLNSKYPKYPDTTWILKVLTEPSMLWDQMLFGK